MEFFILWSPIYILRMLVRSRVPRGYGKRAVCVQIRLLHLHLSFVFSKLPFGWDSSEDMGWVMARTEDQKLARALREAIV